MKPTEEEVNKLEFLRQVATTAYDAWQNYRRELATACEHPPEMVDTYKWEHDNGYGRQTMITGKQCLVCYGKDYWNRGVFDND